VRLDAVAAGTAETSAVNPVINAPEGLKRHCQILEANCASPLVEKRHSVGRPTFIESSFRSSFYLNMVDHVQIDEIDYLGIPNGIGSQLGRCFFPHQGSGHRISMA
jgi:hypothetical protein